MQNKTDKQLINYIRLKSEPALEELMSRYDAKCRRTATRVGKYLAEHEINEIMQDMWFLVWKNAKGFRGEAAVSSWLYRVCFNCALMYLRKQKQPRNAMLKNSEGHEFVMETARCTKALQDEEIAKKQKMQQLAEVVDTLEDTKSKAIILNSFKGFTLEESRELLASQNMGLTIPAMKSRLHRARSLLKIRGIENII